MVAFARPFDAADWVGNGPEIALREAGIYARQPDPPGQMPPQDGAWTLQHWALFSAVINHAQRLYHWTHDDALKDGRCNAIAMRRDPVLMSAMRDRQYPLCQLDWHLVAADETNPRLLDNAEKLTKVLKRTPRFQQLRRCLSEAMWYGRYGVMGRFEWQQLADGSMAVCMADWFPVNGDKLVFRFDGTPGILVNSVAYEGPKAMTPRGQAHFLDDPNELECFFWHEFEPEDPDFHDGTMAGAVHGYGFRGRLYWFWWLRNNLLSILFDFLQKVGLGITTAFFEAGNAASKAEVTSAVKSQIGNNVWLFPRNRDGSSNYAGPGLEHVMVKMEGAQMFLTLFQLLNDLMRRYILGEELTTGTAATGLGSGVAEAHEGTASRRTRYDAADMEQSLQRLVDTLSRWNCPGDPPPRFEFVVEKPDVESWANAANFFYQWGGSIDEDQAREVLGLTKPEQGKAVLSQIQAMQATAALQAPTGVPQVAGPQAGGAAPGMAQPFDPAALGGPAGGNPAGPTPSALFNGGLPPAEGFPPGGQRMARVFALPNGFAANKGAARNGRRPARR